MTIKLASKIGQIRDKLGTRTPMKRLDVGLIYQNRRRRLSLYFKNMHVVLQSEKLKLPETKLRIHLLHNIVIRTE